MTDCEKLDLLLAQIQGINGHIGQIEKQNADTFKELMNVEREVLKNQDAIKVLNAKYDTLRLKADNSTLLLKLIDRQAEEMSELKERVTQLESKLAESHNQKPYRV